MCLILDFAYWNYDMGKFCCSSTEINTQNVLLNDHVHGIMICFCPCILVFKKNICFIRIMNKYSISSNFIDVLNLEFVSLLGKYCCDSGCCDISKELQDKGYVPALPPASPLNVTVSRVEPKTMNAPCFGTQCGSYCIPNVYAGTCCNNPRFACPSLTRCCSNSYSERPWCCRSYQRCSSIRNLCINSAVTTSTAMMSMLFAFMIGVTSKYFL